MLSFYCCCCEAYCTLFLFKMQRHLLISFINRSRYWGNNRSISLLFLLLSFLFLRTSWSFRLNNFYSLTRFLCFSFQSGFFFFFLPFLLIFFFFSFCFFFKLLSSFLFLSWSLLFLRCICIFNFFPEPKWAFLNFSRLTLSKWIYIILKNQHWDFNFYIFFITIDCLWFHFLFWHLYDLLSFFCVIYIRLM